MRRNGEDSQTTPADQRLPIILSEFKSAVLQELRNNPRFYGRMTLEIVIRGSEITASEITTNARQQYQT